MLCAYQESITLTLFNCFQAISDDSSGDDEMSSLGGSSHLGTNSIGGRSPRSTVSRGMSPFDGVSLTGRSPHGSVGGMLQRQRSGSGIFSGPSTPRGASSGFGVSVPDRSISQNHVLDTSMHKHEFEMRLHREAYEALQKKVVVLEDDAKEMSTLRRQLEQRLRREEDSRRRADTERGDAIAHARRAQESAAQAKRRAAELEADLLQSSSALTESRMSGAKREGELELALSALRQELDLSRKNSKRFEDMNKSLKSRIDEERLTRQQVEEQLRAVISDNNKASERIRSYRAEHLSLMARLDSMQEGLDRARSIEEEERMKTAAAILRAETAEANIADSKAMAADTAIELELVSAEAVYLLYKIYVFVLNFLTSDCFGI